VLAFAEVAKAETQAETAGEGLEASVSLAGSPLLTTNFAGETRFSPFNKAWPFDEADFSAFERGKVLPLRITARPLSAEKPADGSAPASQEEGEADMSLYYTASLSYGLPPELALPRDEGLCVYGATYDAEGNEVKDGILKAGLTYTRRITVSTTRDRYYVALSASIPSGAEAIDANFVTSSTEPPSAGTNDKAADKSDWREVPVKSIRGNELQFAWDSFPAGKAEVSFRFRAVEPGVYPAPPDSAACMYEGEVFGRDKGRLVQIKD
jgi:uncharacterized protein YfaS (alpha-2-macroglobulin family)